MVIVITFRSWVDREGYQRSGARAAGVLALLIGPLPLKYIQTPYMFFSFCVNFGMAEPIAPREQVRVDQESP